MRRVAVTAVGMLFAWVAAGAATANVHRPLPLPDAGTKLPVAQVTAPLLAPGERFDAGLFELEVQDSFVEESPTRFGYDEVRLAVALRHSYPFDLHYSPISPTGDDGSYPSIVLRDGDGREYPIDVTRPSSFLGPGSVLVTQPPGIPARWVLSYQVPSAFSSRLTAEARLGEVVLAAWDLNRPARFPSGWSAPNGVTTAGWGTSIEWSEGLTVTPMGGAVLVCGDPETAPALALFGLSALVENTSAGDILWPNVKHPDTAGYAIWRDGSSSRLFDEAHAQTGKDDPVDPLDRVSEEMTVIPPGIAALRYLAFVTPRDGRFVDPAELPEQVLLVPPAGPPTWIDLSGPQVTELTLRASACRGFTNAGVFQVDPRDDP